MQPTPLKAGTRQSLKRMKEAMGKEKEVMVEGLGTLFVFSSNSTLIELLVNDSRHVQLIASDNEDSETLFDSYRRRNEPTKFFTVSKVFCLLWVEPAGETSSLVTIL